METITVPILLLGAAIIGAILLFAPKAREHFRRRKDDD